MSNQKDECRSFEDFRQLDPIQKYELLNGISIISFAIACCRISSKSYLYSLVDFMTEEQVIEFIYLITKIREVLPSEIFVKETQQVIIDINNKYKEHFSSLMNTAEYVSINYAVGLQKSRRRKFIYPMYTKTIH